MFQKYVQKGTTAQQDHQNHYFVHLDTTAQVDLEKLLRVLLATTALALATYIRNVRSEHIVQLHHPNRFGAPLVPMDQEIQITLTLLLVA